MSKRETDRCYPNINVLKPLSEIFGIFIDALISTDEIIDIAGKNIVEDKQKGIFIGLTCFLSLLVLMLPIFRSVKNEFRVR